MSPYVVTLTGFRLGFPRVSGDEPTNGGPGLLGGSFSPRERG